MGFDRNHLYPIIEKQFDIEMPDDCISLDQIESFGDLCHIITEQMQEATKTDTILQGIVHILSKEMGSEASSRVGSKVRLNDVLDP